MTESNLPPLPEPEYGFTTHNMNPANIVAHFSASDMRAYALSCIAAANQCEDNLNMVKPAANQVDESVGMEVVAWRIKTGHGSAVKECVPNEHQSLWKPLVTLQSAQQAISNARREALEEAVKVAEGPSREYEEIKDAYHRNSTTPFDYRAFGLNMAHIEVSRRIADAIRTLAKERG